MVVCHLAAAQVIDALELADVRGRLGKNDARGVFGCEGFDGDTLQLEGVDAEAALTREVDDDTQRHFSLFVEIEADAAVGKERPGKGFLLAFCIADHRLALASYDATGLHVVDIARRDAEAIPACRKGDGLPEAVVEQRRSETAPLRLELYVAVVRGVDVRARRDAVLDNGIGILPPGTCGAHGKAQETTAIAGIDCARSRDVGVFVVGEVGGRDVAMHLCFGVEGEDAQSRVPRIAVGTEVDARGVVAVGGTVDDVAAVLIEVVVEQQVVGRLCSCHIVDVMVAVCFYLVGGECCAPKPYLINLSLESAFAHRDGLQQRDACSQLGGRSTEEYAVAEELDRAGTVRHSIVMPLACDDVPFVGLHRPGTHGDAEHAFVVDGCREAALG